MVKFIDPLTIQSVSAFFLGGNIPGIVEVEFCDQHFFVSRLEFECIYFASKFLNEMARTVIPYGMNGIESQRIDVKLVQPHQGILPIIMANTIAPGVIEIDGFSPAGFIFVCEVWTEFIKIISLRPKVIVDNIKNNSNAPLMRFIHQ